MTKEELIEKLAHDKIGTCVYKKELKALLINPFALYKDGDKYIIIENVERKGEMVVFETSDKEKSFEMLYTLAKEKQNELFGE